MNYSVSVVIIFFGAWTLLHEFFLILIFGAAIETICVCVSEIR